MRLRKVLTFRDLFLAGLGSIIGAGIYVLIGKAAGVSGNSLIFSVIFASLFAISISFSYSFLSRKYPEAGAEFSYAYHSLGRKISSALGIILVLRILSSASAVTIGFSSYLSSMLKIPEELSIILILLFSLFLSIIGVKESIIFGGVISALEVLGLILVIFFTLPYFKFFRVEFNLISALKGASLLFFAWIGFENIARLSEEAKRKEDVQKAIFYSILTSSILYFLVSISCLSILSPEELSKSKKPLMSVLEEIGLNFFAKIVGIIALLSTSNTIIFCLLSSSRILFDMGRKGIAPKFFSEIHKKYKTPWKAAVFSFFVILILSLTKSIKFVAYFSNFFLFLIYFFVSLTAFKEGYKFGILGMISSVILMLFIEKDVLLLGTAIFFLILLISR